MNDADVNPHCRGDQERERESETVLLVLENNIKKKAEGESNEARLSVLVVFCVDLVVITTYCLLYG